MDQLFCVGYDNKNFEKDSILQHGKQMATIKVKRISHDEDELIIYFRPADKGTKGTITLDGKEYDNDYFYGYLNKKDFVNIGITNMTKMIRRYPEFYEADMSISK
jgi:hypothetical protein